MSIPTATIDETGIHLPAYEDVLTGLQDKYRGIYGSDVYLGADSQDGQLVAILALAYSDTNAMAAAVYNAFSPATAQGAGLSSVVKINGIKRQIASNSTVDVKLIGQAGTTISGGIVSDDNGNQWDLPPLVNIPPAGEVTVTATAQTAGAINAAPGAVTGIATPTRGWQSVTNLSSAVPGAPVEIDATLRQRQAKSTALPSRTVLEGMVGAIATLPGVTRYKGFENDTDTTNADGLPSHSVAIVIEGGDATAIANAIAVKKGVGVYTHGTTEVDVVDAYSIVHSIRFFRPTVAAISVAISLKAMVGYTAGIEASIKQAVVDYINALAIGDDVLLTRLYLPANLYGAPNSGAFELTSIAISRVPDSPAASDVVVAFNEAAFCDLAHVAITVVP